MKVWESGDGEVRLTQSPEDTEFDLQFSDSAQEAEKEVRKKKDTRRLRKPVVRESRIDFQKMLDEAWPDNTVTWDRQFTRSSALCSSPEAEDWQCGSYGPKGRYCRRPMAHRGRCSDLFLPEDRKNLTARLDAIKREELGEILGRPKPLRATAQRYDSQKLKAILRQEQRDSRR